MKSVLQKPRKIPRINPLMMLKLMNSTSCLQENYLILKKKMMLRKSWMMIHTISRCLMVPAATTRWTLTRPSPSYRLSMLSLSKLFIRSPRRLLNYPSLVCPTPSSQWPKSSLSNTFQPVTRTSPVLSLASTYSSISTVTPSQAATVTPACVRVMARVSGEKPGLMCG